MTADEIRARFTTAHPQLVEAMEKKGFFEWAAQPPEKRWQSVAKIFARRQLERTRALPRPRLP